LQRKVIRTDYLFSNRRQFSILNDQAGLSHSCGRH